MMSDYLDRGSDALDGFEFLTMAEAGEVGHWAVLGELNKKARNPRFASSSAALPIQRQHLKNARAASARGEGSCVRRCLGQLARGGRTAATRARLFRLRALRAEGDALAGERELDLFARLVDPPLHRGERDLERVRDLGVRKARRRRGAAAPSSGRRSGPRRRARRRRSSRAARTARRAPRAAACRRGCDRARPALARAKLVEHPVLRHLEEPGREPGAEREARQALVDAEEDFLRQILGE